MGTNGRAIVLDRIMYYDYYFIYMIIILALVINYDFSMIIIIIIGLFQILWRWR